MSAGTVGYVDIHKFC